MNTPQKTSPKLVFYHLLSMVTLYISAISLIVLMFNVIDLAIADPALIDQPYYMEGSRSAIRIALSFLIVMFPVYMWTLFSLSNMYKKNEAVREMRVRKWLVYFTLFVAALIILFSFVMLINNLLQGELTMRFFLKFLTTAIVAGGIFGYYRWELKQGKEADDV